MALNGRQVIYIPYKDIDDDNVITALKNAFTIYSSNIDEILYLGNYFKGVQPILNRTKKVRPEINNKIVMNIANQIVSFKTGYLLNKPIQYVANKESVDNASITRFNEYSSLDDKQGKDKKLANFMSIYGTAYKLTLSNPNFDKTNPDSCPFETFILDPSCAFVAYSNYLERKPLMGVLIYTEQNEQDQAEYVYEIYTKNKFYKIKNSVIVDNKPHTYEAIPLVEYPLNYERLGDFEKVIPLLDAINKIESNRVDAIEQYVQSLMVFKNVDIESESFRTLQEMGAIKIKDVDDGERKIEANVFFLNQELNQTQVQALKNNLYQAVLEIVGMPSQSDGNSNDSSNNGAVILKNGWGGADSRATDTEEMFRTSEKKYLNIVLPICRALTLSEIKLYVSDIDIKFTRRNYENILSKAQVLTTMLKESKIAPRLAFVVCGLFQDPELAYSESYEYYKNIKAEELARQIAEKEATDNEDNGGNVEQ